MSIFVRIELGRELQMGPSTVEMFYLYRLQGVKIYNILDILQVQPGYQKSVN